MGWPSGIGTLAWMDISKSSPTARWVLATQSWAMSAALKYIPLNFSVSPDFDGGPRTSKLFTSRIPHIFCTNSASSAEVSRPFSRSTWITPVGISQLCVSGTAITLVKLATLLESAPLTQWLSLKVVVLWKVRPCRLVEMFWRFSECCCFRRVDRRSDRRPNALSYSSYLINSTEQRPSWDGNSCLATEDITRPYGARIFSTRGHNMSAPRATWIQSKSSYSICWRFISTIFSHLRPSYSVPFVYSNWIF